MKIFTVCFTILSLSLSATVHASTCNIQLSDAKSDWIDKPTLQEFLIDWDDNNQNVGDDKQRIDSSIVTFKSGTDQYWYISSVDRVTLGASVFNKVRVFHSLLKTDATVSDYLDNPITNVSTQLVNGGDLGLDDKGWHQGENGFLSPSDDANEIMDFAPVIQASIDAEVDTVGFLTNGVKWITNSYDHPDGILLFIHTEYAAPGQSF